MRALPGVDLALSARLTATEPQQARRQIRHFCQVLLPFPGPLAQLGKLWAQMMPQFAAIFTLIPEPHELPESQY